MTELERKALLGDKEAQKECTEKGIVLPCPKCFKSVTTKEHDGIIVVECKCGLKFHHDSWDEEKEFPKAWNTRQAPPIGRCGECMYFNTTGCSDDCGWCEKFSNGRFEYGYCQCFEPRCE